MAAVSTDVEDGNENVFVALSAHELASLDLRCQQIRAASAASVLKCFFRVAEFLPPYHLSCRWNFSVEISTAHRIAEGIDDFGIEVRSGTAHQFQERVIMGTRFAVWTVGRERIVRVGDRYDF